MKMNGLRRRPRCNGILNTIKANDAVYKWDRRTVQSQKIKEEVVFTELSKKAELQGDAG